MRRKRERRHGKEHIKIPTSNFFSNIILPGIGFLIDDLSKQNSKIKKIISKIIPKIEYDDTKEIKNAKYKVLEGGKQK